MDDFDLEIKQTFLEESLQLLDDAEAAFIALDSGNFSGELIDKIFRLAHNFKGSAKSVGFEELSKFAHKFEDVLSDIKKGSLHPDKRVCSVLLEVSDFLKSYVLGLKADINFTTDTSRMIARLLSLREASHPTASSSENSTSTPSPTPSNTLQTIKPPSGSPPSLEDESIRVSMRKLNSLLDLVGELVLSQTSLTKHRIEGTLSSPASCATVTYLQRVVDDVQHLSMSLRMVPIRPLFQKLSRTLRDVATSQQKSVELITAGEHVELDKTIFERISDPLTHIIRNAVDHGIESTEERNRRSKPSQATVKLLAAQNEDRFVIKISDDGRGLDKNRLVQKAVEKGIISGTQKLSDSEAYSLIFKPGFSTKDQISDISGRGVGMDVVQRAIDELKGNIAIETELGKGTVFTISLPLSLSIFTGMVVGVDGARYVVPVSQLVETIQMEKLDKDTHMGSNRLANIRGEVIPIWRLGELLCTKKERRSTENQSKTSTTLGIIASHQGRKITFEVDEILGHEQIVLKRLGFEMRQLIGVIGGAVLSNGEPSLVVSLTDLISKGIENGTAA